MRTRSIRLGTALILGLVAVLAVFVTRSSSDSVSAQGFPPNPPTIYYGTVTASVPNGAAVIAVVRAGSSSATCGAGKVLLDGSQRVYAVQVITHSQRAGCGDTGRTVSFYVTPPSATEGGKLSNESPSWTDWSQAQNPPPIPDFTTVFGQVQLDGANISPSEQTVIAFVNGHACGWGATQVAPDHPDNPPGDVGKTVYDVDVRADGSGIFQIPGCGTQNAAISFYFPESGRMAAEQTTFAGAGFVRVDLSLEGELSHRLSAQLTASDGIVN